MMNLLTHKRCITALICALACTIGVVGAKKQKQAKQACNDEQNCKRNKKCQCYCAYKGDLRDKTKEDKPIWFEEGLYGHKCYCQERDVEHETKVQKGEIAR